MFNLSHYKSRFIHLCNLVALMSLGFVPVAIAQQAVILKPGPDERADSYGNAVALDGDNALIATRENDGGNIYVYRKENDQWRFKYRLFEEFSESFDAYGAAMDIEGDQAIIGAPGGENFAGIIYTYQLQDEVWVRTDSITASDIDGDNNQFGYSIDIDENYAFIGAITENDAGTSNGAVYVFQKEEDRWVEKIKLLPDSDPIFDIGLNFGIAVAIDGDYALIGTNSALLDDSPPAEVYAYKRDGDMWNKIGLLIGTEREENDRFGVSISMDEGYAAIASRASEQVHIFKREGDDWVEKEILRSPGIDESADFGNSVSLKGAYCAVGAESEDGLNGVLEIFAGAAYIFKREGEAWDSGQRLVSDKPVLTGQYGSTVTLSEEELFVAAVNELRSDSEDLEDGVVYVYNLSDIAISTSIDKTAIPTQFEVHQNFPNPFSQSTSINYSLREGAYIRLEVFSLLGRKVALLEDSFQAPGSYQINWNPKALPSGQYIYRFYAGNTSTTRLMTKF